MSSRKGEVEMRLEAREVVSTVPSSILSPTMRKIARTIDFPAFEGSKV
jgi:hypothetical protein